MVQVQICTVRESVGRESALNKRALGEGRWSPVWEGSGTIKERNSHLETNKKPLLCGGDYCYPTSKGVLTPPRRLT